MSPAFEEALAARMLWLDVVVFGSIEECESETATALEAAYSAVHMLAHNDVHLYRHYGPTPPLMLQDVPELAEHYETAYLVYSELRLVEMHGGPTTKLTTVWGKTHPLAPVPFTEWLAESRVTLAAMMDERAYTVSEVMENQISSCVYAWSRGESATWCAEELLSAYECMKEFEEEEAYRQYCQDIADTYDSIEADLWAGWRQEYEEEQSAA